MKYWEIIAGNLGKAGLSWGCVSTIDANGRTIWIADARSPMGQPAWLYAGHRSHPVRAASRIALRSHMRLSGSAAKIESAEVTTASLMVRRGGSGINNRAYSLHRLG